MTTLLRVATAAVIGVLAVGGALYAVNPGGSRWVGGPGPRPASPTPRRSRRSRPCRQAATSWSRSDQMGWTSVTDRPDAPKTRQTPRCGPFDLHRPTDRRKGGHVLYAVVGTAPGAGAGRSSRRGGGQTPVLRRRAATEHRSRPDRRGLRQRPRGSPEARRDGARRRHPRRIRRQVRRPAGPVRHLRLCGVLLPVGTRYLCARFRQSAGTVDLDATASGLSCSPRTTTGPRRNVKPSSGRLWSRSRSSPDGIHPPGECSSRGGRAPRDKTKPFESARTRPMEVQK